MDSGLGQRSGELGCNADILHDERIDARPKRLTGELHGVVGFVRKDGRVERQIHGHAAQVRKVARSSERFERKVLGRAPRVERFDAQVYRIGARLHGRMETLLVSRRSEQFGCCPKRFGLHCVHDHP